ncbi:uncharacterized protein BKA55DRAFT_587077 [Fusarium redolens]|uniref:Uncharacterized protein n=1 Tax=Fusarium redolens TaxID=48865 RepID=A0A9P9JPT6_FUSRE|nr:uncharacterized protein BKA55DRAFT_587077 [Fusarium redolens]KAH7205371.1 hypothetical protein BKA55DRAFT_587077 [Fusarium redolens]
MTTQRIRVPVTEMPAQMKYGLWCNRPTSRQVISFDDSSETIECFNQRKNETREEMAANRRLNDRTIWRSVVGPSNPNLRPTPT